MESQLNILAESLDKKLKLLQQIQEYNAKQEQVFRSGDVKLEDFDQAVEEKGKLITQLTGLDEGFEILYAKLARELENNKEQYAQQIKTLQQKVTQVTDLSMSVQAQEQRNKKLIEEYFSKERANIGKGRKTSKAAYNYYKNMSGSNVAPPRFLDSKK